MKEKLKYHKIIWLELRPQKQLSIIFWSAYKSCARSFFFYYVVSVIFFCGEELRAWMSIFVFHRCDTFPKVNDFSARQLRNPSNRIASNKSVSTAARRRSITAWPFLELALPSRDICASKFISTRQSLHFFAEQCRDICSHAIHYYYGITLEFIIITELRSNSLLLRN